MKSNPLKINLSLDSISSIVERNQNIPPNQIMCALCYCIAFNGQHCNNRKCMKVFCFDCIEKQKQKFTEKDKNEFKCPFCQTFSGFSKLDDDIIDYIKTFKYYCNKNKNCKEQYNYDTLIKEHLHLNDSVCDEKCYVCKKIINESNMNNLKCNICNNSCCYQNISYDAIKSNINNKKNNENNFYCIQRCFSCKMPICKYCARKNFYKGEQNFICDDCVQEYKCFKCSNNCAKNICIICKKLICENCSEKCEKCGFIFCKDKKCSTEKNFCENCKSFLKQTNNNNCNHKNILNCLICFPKCYICKINNSDIDCKCCKNKICIKNCSAKCKICSSFCCNQCSLICSICKKILCNFCANFCNECDKDSTLISCKICNSNTIKKCQYNKSNEECNKKICISCWNSCNFCGIIFCSDHSIVCTNCEDPICDKHYTKCDKCFSKEELTYMKLCYKKCVLKCSFCNSISTVLCKKKNHKDNFVYNFGCPHNICDYCLKKCATCGKIVRKCLECLDYFYELCKFCQKYQCLTCCNKCEKCDEPFCSLSHKCCLCNNDFKGGRCYNCDINKKNKCAVCGKNLKICESCKSKFICDFSCYKKYKNKLICEKADEHLCFMYFCENHLGSDLH